MKFNIMNRTEAIQYAKNEHAERAAIVSISSRSHSNANLTIGGGNNIQGIIFLSFDDTESSISGISESQAKHIIDFVDSMKNDVDKIIVHCDAGVSRSAGVCAAIEKYLGYDDSNIFDTPKYIPNMRCYRTVLNCGMNKKEENNNA